MDISEELLPDEFIEVSSVFGVADGCVSIAALADICVLNNVASCGLSELISTSMSEFLDARAAFSSFNLEISFLCDSTSVFGDSIFCW